MLFDKERCRVLHVHNLVVFVAVTECLAPFFGERIAKAQPAAGATLVVNPGSVGVQAYDDDHPFAHVVEAGNPLARWALVERGAAGWQASLCATAYDCEAAARRAEANGRGDWAAALRTGRVGRLEAEVVAGPVR